VCTKVDLPSLTALVKSLSRGMFYLDNRFERIATKAGKAPPIVGVLRDATAFVNQASAGNAAFDRYDGCMWHLKASKDGGNQSALDVDELQSFVDDMSGFVAVKNAGPDLVEFATNRLTKEIGAQVHFQEGGEVLLGLSDQFLTVYDHETPCR
jgi:hypothetical protein